MKIIYSPDHAKRNAKTELYGGKLRAPFECPERMDFILGEAKRRSFGKVLPPAAYGEDPVLAVHDSGYVEFLRTSFERWTELGFDGEAIVTVWPARSMRGDRIPKHFEGQLGYYCLASETSLSEGTFEAALASKDVALTAADFVRGGERGAFGLCRPPGHHASVDQFGGYCFFNNAAITAQHFRNNGAGRVAILDVDFHHGNGTQQIFYERDDVLTISLHGDPDDAFPHFLGFDDETGKESGDGFNLNLPMPPGTGFDIWRDNLENALNLIGTFSPEQLIVSLGVDTFEADPISFFKLKSPDFLTIGADIAATNLPTTFLMEGGYAIEGIGVNVINVLAGFEGA